LESITIGGDCPFSLDAMERGLYKRFNNMANKPQIFQAKIAFMHRKKQDRSHPCPTSIIWCAVRNRYYKYYSLHQYHYFYMICKSRILYSALEVAVAGRKQGITKKKKGSNLLISRQMLLRTFLEIFDKYQDHYSEIRHPKKITYYDWKQWSITYTNKWEQLKLESFCNWPRKLKHLRNFSL